jgi:hypothetical protein
MRRVVQVKADGVWHAVRADYSRITACGLPEMGWLYLQESEQLGPDDRRCNAVGCRRVFERWEADGG